VIRRLAPLALVLLTAAAPARLTEPQVRAFVARQSAAWNARDLAAWAMTFTPDARFTDQALANSNTIVPYGSSTLKEARVQVRKTFARGPVSETVSIDSVVLSPDGRGARVSAHVFGVSGGQRVCAQRVETIIGAAGGPVASAQTDTIVRCRAAALR
jgi:hypothetical protein